MDNKLIKIVKLVLVAAIFFSTAPVLNLAKAVDTCTMDFRKNSKVVTVCNKGYMLDVAPFVQDGALYLPVRFFFERFGADVSWSVKSVFVHYDHFDFVVQANSKKSTVNGSSVTLSKNTALKNGRLFMAATDFETITKNWGIVTGITTTSDKSSITIDKSKLRYLWNDFTKPLMNGDGKTVTFSKVLAEPDTKAVIVQIWYTGCAGCVNVLKLFQGFWTKYQDKGLKIVSVSTDGPGNEDARAERLDNAGITYPVCLDETYSLKPEWYDPIFPNYYLVVPGEKYIRIFQEGWDVDANANFEKTIDSLCSGN